MTDIRAKPASFDRLYTDEAGSELVSLIKIFTKLL